MMAMSDGISHLAQLRDEIHMKVEKVDYKTEDENEVMAYSFSLEDTLGTAPAETFGDVVAKLRASFAQLYRAHNGDFPPCVGDLRNLASAIHNLERHARN